MRQTGILLLCAILFCALGSAASSDHSASPASLNTESIALGKPLSSLSYFSGEWNCRGRFIRSGKPISSRMRFAPVLAGAWLEMRSDDVPPNRFHAREFWGFDGQTRQFRNFILDDFAGGRLFTSPGWAGDKLVWSGDAVASKPAIAQQFVFEKKSATAFVVTWQVRKPGRSWAVGDRLTCSKTK